MTPPDEPESLIATSTPKKEGCAQYQDLINKYPWNKKVAMAVMKAESGCNEDAVNRKDKHATCKGSYGLFQIGCVHASKEGFKDVMEPEVNIKLAYEVYKSQGWGAWGAYTNGSYLRHRSK